mmetsp:Transcript_41919/g.118843  ORF Transcript_41919/g.118843 Transcript_41919/m.118843 type:complete len:227 (+) Transcript_41919:230-910(+)
MSKVARGPGPVSFTHNQTNDTQQESPTHAPHAQRNPRNTLTRPPDRNPRPSAEYESFAGLSRRSGRVAPEMRHPEPPPRRSFPDMRAQNAGCESVDCFVVARCYVVCLTATCTAAVAWICRGLTQINVVRAMEAKAAAAAAVDADQPRHAAHQRSLADAISAAKRALSAQGVQKAADRHAFNASLEWRQLHGQAEAPHACSRISSSGWPLLCRPPIPCCCRCYHSA